MQADTPYKRARQEEHGEAFIKVSKKKKEKGKTTVATVHVAGKAGTVESTPAESRRKRRRSKGDAEDD